MNMFSMMVKKGFQDSDKDNSGYIDWDELKGALIKLSKDLKLPTVTDDDVDRYLEKLDIDKNGIITENEFGKLFQEMIAAKGKK